MAGLVPAIHVYVQLEFVDARHRAGHDEEMGYGVPKGAPAFREA
jgi:hypothetical protein